MSIIEQIKALQLGFWLRQHEPVPPDGKTIRPIGKPIDPDDLKALAESHERLLKAAKDYHDTCPADEDLTKPFENATSVLRTAIAEAEKL